MTVKSSRFLYPKFYMGTNGQSKFQTSKDLIKMVGDRCFARPGILCGLTLRFILHMKFDCIFKFRNVNWRGNSRGSEQLASTKKHKEEINIHF